MEALIVLGIPIAVAAFFLIILVIFVGILFFEYRRNRMGRNRGEQFEDDDQAYAEEVAETYMRLLEPVVYDKNEFKYMDCSICLREFDEGETL